MRQQTNYQLPTAELYQAGTFFANLGLECPWVGEDAWCDLKANLVYACDNAPAYYEGGHVECPPAVAAAVVWFAIRLRKWDMVRQMRDHAKAVKGMDYHDRIDRKPWPRQYPETVEQATALILGVWRAMGGE